MLVAGLNPALGSQQPCELEFVSDDAAELQREQSRRVLGLRIPASVDPVQNGPQSHGGKLAMAQAPSDLFHAPRGFPRDEIGGQRVNPEPQRLPACLGRAERPLGSLGLGCSPGIENWISSSSVHFARQLLEGAKWHAFWCEP